jgi:hypothetical protein
MSVKRAIPLSGIGFVVFFLAGVGVSDVPSSSASDRAWLAAYSGHGKQAGHLATGFLLVLAGLCLLAFITHLWRAAAAAGDGSPSPLPVLSAAVAAACMAAGGILMAAASATALLYSEPLPGADVLRFANDAGFGLAGVAGMLAAALSVLGVSAQARAAGLFGARMRRFSLLVATVLLASIVFVPILALLAWVIAATVVLVRRTDRAASSGLTPRPASVPSP